MVHRATFFVCHGGRTHGQAFAHGRRLGDHRTGFTPTPSVSQGRSPAHRESTGTHRHTLCLEDGDPVGIPSPRNGLWLWNDLLAPPAGLAGCRGVAGHPPYAAQSAPGRRAHRLVACSRRQCERSSRFWGAKTGPNPTDRAKPGSKHHLLSDANGIPLATILTAANCNDVTQLIPLIDAIPPVSGKPGRPQRRPDSAYADRGYDSDPHREKLRQRRIIPVIARRGTEHGSGLGRYRWVIERSLSWLHQFRRLRNRYERRSDIHEAFMFLGCSVICWRFLQNGLC